MTTTGLSLIIVGALLVACIGGPVDVTRDRGVAVARFNAPAVIGLVMCWVGAVMFIIGAFEYWRAL